MNNKVKFLISVLCIFICNNTNSFATENNISSESTSSNNLYNITSNDNENNKQNQEIELSTSNYRDVNTFLSISDCEQLENIIREIHNSNEEKGGWNEDLIARSAFALNLAKELTEYARKLKHYKSIYYAINCYKTLTHLMYTIGKYQNDTEGYSTSIGTVKVHSTQPKHITDNKQKEEELHKFINKFIPFYNYVSDEIYTKMFTKSINTSVLFKLGKVLERKSDEITYINASILPQVKYLINTANKISVHILLLRKNITLFKMFLNETIKTIKNYWISNESVDEEIINLINTLENSVINNKSNIEIDISKCKELLDKIRTQVNNIDGRQWSYAYNLLKSLPDLATEINHNRNIIIESNFSFAHNLDYLIKLIIQSNMFNGNDKNYKQEIYNILEELKYCNPIDEFDYNYSNIDKSLTNTIRKPKDKKEESDEELVNRINKILNIDPKNPISILNQNRRYYDKYGNTMVQTNRYGLDKNTMIKKEDMDRYNMLMKKRNNYTNLTNSRSPFSTNYNYDYNYFNIDKSWINTIRKSKDKKEESDEEFLNRLLKETRHHIIYPEHARVIPNDTENRFEKITRTRDFIGYYLKQESDEDFVNRLLETVRKDQRAFISKCSKDDLKRFNEITGEKFNDIRDIIEFAKNNKKFVKGKNNIKNDDYNYNYSNVDKPLNAIRKSEDKKEDEKEGTNNKFLERLRHDMAERIKIMYKKRKQKVNANHSSDKYKDESVKENQPSINVDENSSLKKQLDNLFQEKETDKILMEEKLRKLQEDNQKYREEINMLRNKLKEKDELIKKLKMQAEQVNNNNSYDNQLGYHLPTSVVQNWY